MNKKILIIIVSIVIISLFGLFLFLGGARTDVYLKDFELSQDGKTMTLKVGVSSSAGYIRKMKRTSGSINYYYTFYSTFGINSKLGAKDKFTINIDNNVDEIYFYSGKKGYKKVLELNESGQWVRANEYQYQTNIKNVSVKIYNISNSKATIVITDTNKRPYTYGSWYRIDKLENEEWTELEPVIENYGFTSIGYLPDENDELKFEVDWEWLYGKLIPGNYRIVKEVNNQYIYIPFNIDTV